MARSSNAYHCGRVGGFLGMGRTKGAKGTKGRFIGASREGSGNRFPFPVSQFSTLNSKL